jgi:transcriptional regulator with XRE-family HTH domain
VIGDETRTGDREAFAAAVRRERQRKGWSQYRLAEELGTQRTQVSRIEEGKVDGNLSLIRELGRVFEVQPAKFIWPVVGEQGDLADIIAAFWREVEDNLRAAVRRREVVALAFMAMTLPPAEVKAVHEHARALALAKHAPPGTEDRLNTAVGVYESATGVRLPVTNDEVQAEKRSASRRKHETGTKARKR